MSIEIRHPTRSDTFDLRDKIHSGDNEELHAHADAANYMDDEEQHSVLEDDSDGEEQNDIDDDDMSSDLSIPNESIDFDLVYAFHSFAATVEGQANVVKGDSLFLMDDSNSYWWLVRVLKTQEVGYIPAENIETPFERLARLNKHRNVDLAKATEAEERLHITRKNSSGVGSDQSHSSTRSKGNRSRAEARSVIFNSSFSVNRYPPAIWAEEETEDEDEEWDDAPYEYEDLDIMEEQNETASRSENAQVSMDPDDGMDWDDSAVEEMRAQQAEQARKTTMLNAQQDVVNRQLHHQTSQERLQIDPAEVTETKKLTVTPNIAREDESDAKSRSTGPLLPSAIMQQRMQEEEKKRLRDEEEEAARKKSRMNKMPPPVSSAPIAVANKPQAAPVSGSKLRKTPSESDDESKGKKRGMLSSIFGRKKEKGNGKEKSSVSLDLGEGRNSSESSRSGGTIRASEGSPTTVAAMQQQTDAIRNSTDPKRQQQQTGSVPSSPPQVSQLRQRDQQQQALYQQYLNRSPSSPPEAQPSYGLQSASAVLQDRGLYHSSSVGSSTSALGPPSSRQRPGSLIMSSTSVPDLSVIRVFAGKDLQTDATFKTVLLNASTTSHDLVRQALQRFRLPAGESEHDYYLTVKQIEGSSAKLKDDERPLVVFESLVEAALELPKVKRSSMGSISSISSNLSMHPAIKKLPMNDFTDDSAVKFYLNRRGNGGSEDGDSDEMDADETLTAADVSGDLDVSGRQYLTVSTASSGNVPAERFSSPSFRFAIQLVIQGGDLPEDMAFDTLTEAIVFKETLRERSHSSVSSSLSMDMRRKVFVFPKNVTVAEVIELGLERFGISEGVVDGGDEVEDKSTKRRSVARVRYGLAVSINGQERELSPSSKVFDAFPRPPANKNGDRKSQDMKRRSIDSTLLLGSMDDVAEDDPLFILRRAVSYRNSSSRHRMSAPLDEIALRNLHRESASSQGSEPTSNTEAKSQLSHREIIEAQRQAKRENQRAIVSAQANSARGLDVLLPGNTMLRSSRYDVNDRMRYSYVDVDGETYDISDLVEKEWKEREGQQKNDLLEGVLDGTNKDGGAKLNRVLSKIRSKNAGAGVGAGGNVEGRSTPTQTSLRSRSASPASQYSIDDRSRSVTPGSAALTGRFPGGSNPRPGTTTPTQRPGGKRRQVSIGSVMSDLSGYVTAPTPTAQQRSPTTDSAGSHKPPTPARGKQTLFLPKDDFGVDQMIAVIDCRASKGVTKPELKRLDEVDEMLFGRSLDSLRLHPKVRDVYVGAFKELEDVERYLDDMLAKERAPAPH